MGKISIITRKQKIILDELSQNPIIKSDFYFTGGTALSEYYLSHRLSEDIDLFTEKKLNNQFILSLMEKLGKKLGFDLNSRFVDVVYIFNLTFKDKTNLKIDFASYPYKQLDKRLVIDGMKIDSLLDIATNKMLSISQRTDVKDFVDLYYLLKQFTIWDLIEGVRIKFKQKLDRLLIASDFLKVEDFTILPRMIVPLTFDELKSFFRNKAKELGSKAVEE